MECRPHIRGVVRVDLKVIPKTFIGKKRIKACLSFRKFRADARGNVTITFALAVIPMLGLAGLAMDYAQLLTARQKLQSATDLAALSLTTSALAGSTTAQTDFNAKLAANFSHATPTGTLTVMNDKSGVCADASVTLDAGLSAMFGVGAMTARAHACAKVRQETFEIALAMDNSGSMANASKSGTTKLQAAIDAARNLIDTVNPDAENPRAALSVVPFSAAVNVGAANRTKAFMDANGKSTIHWRNFDRDHSSWLPKSKFQMFDGIGVAWGGCVEERPGEAMTSDAAADAGTPDSLFAPFLYPDGADGNRNVLNNYLDDAPDVCTSADTATERQARLCKYKAGTVSLKQSGFGSGFQVGPNLLCTSQAITTLTNVTATAKSAINSMVAKGDTNLVAGFMWAWRTISPNGPFNDQALASLGPQNAKPYNYVSSNGVPNRKVIVLLTDGKNNWAADSDDPNRSAYSSFGFYANAGVASLSSARAYMDAATLKACANAKAAGVEIFTVGFTATDGIDDDGLNLLKSCATDASHSFVAPDGSSLVAAFKTIASSFMKLKLIN